MLHKFKLLTVRTEKARTEFLITRRLFKNLPYGVDFFNPVGLKFRLLEFFEFCSRHYNGNNSYTWQNACDSTAHNVETAGYIGNYSKRFLQLRWEFALTQQYKKCILLIHTIQRYRHKGALHEARVKYRPTLACRQNL